MTRIRCVVPRETRASQSSALPFIKRTEFVREFVRDRRSAAVHEAGHVVIAKMLGVPVWAYIAVHPGVQSEMNFDFRSERVWYGRTRCLWDDASDDQLRMIGVAGAVAELCWLREPLDDECFYKMSDGDWCMAQCDPDNPDEKCMEALDAVARLLRASGPCWGDLLIQTRKLIVTSQAILRANTEQIAVCENAV